MTEKITDDIIQQFKDITGYDVDAFFTAYINFVEVDYPSIVDFYSGITSTSPTTSLKALNSLSQQYKLLIDIIVLNSNQFNNYEYWALVENVESIGGVLETANNISKWLRSSLTKDGYKQQVVTSQYTSQGQTLERLERDKLNSTNFRDSWINTALQNELREEDYNSDGGLLIKVIYQNSTALFLNSIIDNIDTSEKTYGKDIDRAITIEDSDIVVLDYKDTIMQSAQILLQLQKGDDPAFPDRGLNVLGGNVAGISYPIIFRQLASIFATDDSFKSFAIKDVRKNQDAVFIDVEFETRAGDVFSNFVQL